MDKLRSLFGTEKVTGTDNKKEDAPTQKTRTGQRTVYVTSGKKESVAESDSASGAPIIGRNKEVYQSARYITDTPHPKSNNGIKSLLRSTRRKQTISQTKVTHHTFQVEPRHSPISGKVIAAPKTQIAPQRSQHRRTTTAVPELPRELAAKGYEFVDKRKFAQGGTQSVYILTKKTTQSFGRSEFVLKIPDKKSRERELKGLNIQEQLVKSNNGDRYFVPVTEKIFEDGDFIGHVEPKGVPVHSYVSNHGLTIEQRFRFFTQMITALQTMNVDCEIAHLDIKPDNFIMDSAGSEAKPRFCDFDLSRRLEALNIKTKIPGGTYEYLCHEVLKGELCPPEMVDLWGFTLTIWRLMTSETPSRNWFFTMIKTDKREDLLKKFFSCFPESGLEYLDEKKELPDDKKIITDNKIIETINLSNQKNRRKFQIFFWENLDYPDDIDELKISALEKWTLKEMLNIMRNNSTYIDKINQMNCLINSISLIVGLLRHKHNEDHIRNLVIRVGYDPSPMSSMASYTDDENKESSSEVTADKSLTDSKQTPLQPSKTLTKKAENEDLPVKNEQFPAEDNSFLATLTKFASEIDDYQKKLRAFIDSRCILLQQELNIDDDVLENLILTYRITHNETLEQMGNKDPQQLMTLLRTEWQNSGLQ